jgi:FlaA1/EpsC-like NDP-sugar epimerase
LWLSKHRKQLVFLMDLMIMTGVAVILFLLSPVGNGTGGSDLRPLFFNLVIWFLCIIFFQVIFRTYDSLWRYAQGKEYLFLLLGFGCGTALYLLITTLFFPRQLAGLYMISVLGSSLIGMLLIRFGYRTYRARRMRGKPMDREGKQKVAIIGAGDAGVLLLQEFLRKDANHVPTLMLDDNPAKIGMKILGVPVMGPIDSLPELLQGADVKELILAIPSCPPYRKGEILKLCTQTGCRLRLLPDLTSLLSGEKPLMPHMRPAKVEDLLGREPIRLGAVNARQMITGKTVMVTGGGGSIGSELCRQIGAFSPRRLVVLDNYEHGAYDLQQELKRKCGDALDVVIEIATIQDNMRVQRIFKEYHPDIVFHAAAHKHVPLMESNPIEAVKNNVFGMLNVVRAACENSVDKFVLISTDKAVNPTNVMGTTKRLCEMILSSRNGIGSTKFVAVRFGNVLGSNGSVIPLFEKQIKEGGPVTITDKRIIRYFMTISEAVSLILQAGAMASSSEVYVLDMGKPVRILDLAENLIRLSGYQPYEEIPIVEIGLRPGEKLYEELLVSGKTHKKTANELIFVEKCQRVPPSQVEEIIHVLKSAVQSERREVVLQALHYCVPEFRPPEEVNKEFDETVEYGSEQRKVKVGAAV